MKKKLRCIPLGLRLGAVYYIIEGLWRGGWAHVSMVFVGGIVGLLVGGINQWPKFYNLRIITQSIIGAIITLLVELCAGLVLNIWLGMSIWDYSNLPFNLWGQICPQFSLAWIFIMPFAIWLDDRVRWEKWREGRPYPIYENYRDLFKKQRGIIWND